MLIVLCTACMVISYELVVPGIGETYGVGRDISSVGPG